MEELSLKRLWVLMTTAFVDMLGYAHGDVRHRWKLQNAQPQCLLELAQHAFLHHIQALILLRLIGFSRCPPGLWQA